MDHRGREGGAGSALAQCLCSHSSMSVFSEPDGGRERGSVSAAVAVEDSETRPGESQAPGRAGQEERETETRTGRACLYLFLTFTLPFVYFFWNECNTLWRANASANFSALTRNIRYKLKYGQHCLIHLKSTYYIRWCYSLSY